MPSISFGGQLEDKPRIRAGFIGCGSHSFRNVYPTLQFAPVELVATCDLELGKAQAFARQFGAASAYDDVAKMLAAEQLDAVFVVVGYNKTGRPMYPQIACQALQAGCSVWIEKPPAASVADIQQMRQAAEAAGRHVMVGFKKMFMPANQHAKALMQREGFDAHMAMLRYPQHIPTAEEFAQYRAGERIGSVVGFLDHLCHPMSLLLWLFGMPARLHYSRSRSSGGLATFEYDDGRIASLALTCGQSQNGGMERTMIVGHGEHIVVSNNMRVSLHRGVANLAYGASPSYFIGEPEGATAVWEPEFSLGQLYNKGLFLLGYVNEVTEFANSVLENRAPAAGTLDHAEQVTRTFEAFAEGPGKVIDLS